jgi:Carboxypeptidase regulatory-like domain
MRLKNQLAGLFMLLLLGSLPVWAASASVSGIVRDSAGVPQIGAEVQLLRSDYSVAARTYTDSQGRFLIASIFPGHYALKAINSSFLPSMRENLRLRSGSTVVNLTLNTLYEVMQWLPAQPRAADAHSDDWDWTLRSAADRPLLRWLENGPLVVVSDGSGATPRLKARIMATGQMGTFGESGERFTASVEETPQNSRELLARVDFDPNTDAGMESMLGFRQDLGYAGSVQSVAAIAIHPEMEGAGDKGVEEIGLSSREAMHLGDLADVEAGSTEAVGHTSAGTTAQALPFASVAWHTGNSTMRYRMATMLENPVNGSSDAAMPRYAVRNGELVFEHGTHQEIGWERRTSTSDMALLVFADNIKNPVLEASAHFAAGNGPTAGDGQAAGAMLYDPASGLIRTAGPGYSSAGVLASVEHALPGKNLVRASYATGDAMVMPALAQSDFSELIAAAHTRHVQAYSLSLSGILDGTGTRWQASYRWQPDDTVTELAPFAVEAMAPYLNLHVCQKLHQSHDGSSGVEALVEVRNLLAQGYHPFLLGDGSILIFAQDERSLRAGLAFTF